jgi:hypothetical protein
VSAPEDQPDAEPFRTWVPADARQRPAEPGELCTCGRQARDVYITAKFGPVGSCGRQDGGRGGPKPCPFCHGTVEHPDDCCPRYTLRPATADPGRPDWPGGRRRTTR